MDQFLPAEHRLKKCGRKGFLKSFDKTDPTNAVLPPVNQTDTTNAALVTNKISMTMTDGHAESIIDLNNSVAAPSKADNKVSLNSAGRTMFHCYMCKFKNTRTSLYTHYATVHFKVSYWRKLILFGSLQKPIYQLFFFLSLFLSNLK